MSDQPLLKVHELSKFYGSRIGCRDVSFDLWSPDCDTARPASPPTWAASSI